MSFLLRGCELSVGRRLRRAGGVLLRGGSGSRVDGAVLFLKGLHQRRFGIVDVGVQCVAAELAQVFNYLAFICCLSCKLGDDGEIVRRHDNAGVEPLAGQ